jgi:DNA repair exonuclease SbcCD ATPase subunit
LELSIKQKDRKRIQLAVRNFAAWLQSLLYLLERVSRGSGIPEPMLLEMHWTKPVNYSFIKETTSFMMQIQKDLQNLIKQYEEASHPDFPIFSESAGKILSEAWPKFKSILQDHDATEYNILNNMLGHVKNQFSFLEMQIDHLNTRARHIEKMQQQYEQILTTIDNYHDLLAEMKSQLARSLAPRNLSRQFKDMDLRIEHIVLNKGEVFPSDYYALLNIENDPTGPERIIAEEDGDIFLFRLDDLKDALIPKIILEEG